MRMRRRELCSGGWFGIRVVCFGCIKKRNRCGIEGGVGFSGAEGGKSLLAVLVDLVLKWLTCVMACKEGGIRGGKEGEYLTRWRKI